jgi:hypothetical protein
MLLWDAGNDDVSSSRRDCLTLLTISQNAITMNSLQGTITPSQSINAESRVSAQNGSDSLVPTQRLAPTQLLAEVSLLCSIMFSFLTFTRLKACSSSCWERAADRHRWTRTKVEFSIGNCRALGYFACDTDNIDNLCMMS